MPHRADILTSLPRQMALALAITGMLASAAPAAGQQTIGASPRELWRAYPLEGAGSGGQPARIRLPAGSEAPARGGRPVASANAGNGGRSPLPIAAAAAGAALLCGLLLGRRRRVAMAGAAADQETPRAERLRAVPEPEREPDPLHPAPEEQPAAAAPEPASVPLDAPAPEPAGTPLHAAPPEPRPAAPEPLHAAPSEPAAEPLRAAPDLPLPEPLHPDLAPPPTPLELEVERLRTGRFERQPWPAETEGRWRCEIGWHAGTISAGFRAMAAAPGRRRPKEVGRAEPQRFWGAAPPEPPTAELVAAADRLAAALLDAGWEPVAGGGEHWYATRFAWPHAEPPPRRVRVRPPSRVEEVPRGA